MSIRLSTFHSRGLKASWGGLSASWRGLRAYQRGLRASQRGLRACQRVLRACQRGLRVCQRSLRTCQRGLRACQVAPWEGRWMYRRTDGKMDIRTCRTFVVPSQKLLQMRSNFRTREQTRSDLTPTALMAAQKNKS